MGCTQAKPAAAYDSVGPRDEVEVSLDEYDPNRRVTFYFLRSAKVCKLAGDRLPTFREAKAAGLLIQRTMTLGDALRGKYVKEILAVSHRWDTSDEPDTTGEQFIALKEHLNAHPEIKLVFFDFSCMPQGKRTEEEQAEFSAMLREINIIYVGGAVLIIMDRTYMSRFWTQYGEVLLC